MDKIANFNSPVVDNIVNLIDKKGLEQKAVAKMSGFTPQSFCDVLYGRRILKISETQKIAEVLGVEMNELFKTE